MTAARSTLEELIAAARGMQDREAAAALESALAALDGSDDPAAVLRAQIEERSRAAATIAGIDAAAGARLRREGEVLTIALARLERSRGDRNDQ